MIRAILAGQKSQTRRVAKNPAKCPYGVFGDVLWVRETHRINGWSDDATKAFIQYAADGEHDTVDIQEDNVDKWLERQRAAMMKQGAVMQADGCVSMAAPFERKWSPSIHMPRWAARILLEVTSVRLERVADISEPDAVAEGVRDCQEFQELWNVINLNRGFGWAINPLVWVVDFRVLEKTGV